MGVFLFKKIKLLRKAFLTNFLQFHYSQFGEDIVLREILHKDIVDGFYVDVGCFHPKKFSNTYFLYKLGWKGINIDMEEDKVSLFNLVRPKDINILSAISDVNEDVKLYRFDKYGHGSTIDKNFALDTKIPVLDEGLIRTKTLNEVLDSSIYKDKQIDILSIESPVIRAATNRLIPIGGVRNPISQVNTVNIPKTTGSIPSFTAKGKNTAVKITI